MAGIIRNLKNPFTGKFIFPVTKTRAIYDDYGNRLDNLLEAMKSIAGNNILINSNFANPVNQRGFVSGEVTHSAYTIDRWLAQYFNDTSVAPILTINENYITLGAKFNGVTNENARLTQYIEHAHKYSGKEVTMSIKYRTRGENSANLMLGCNINNDNTVIANNLQLPKSSGWNIASKTVKLPDVISSHMVRTLNIMVCLGNLDYIGDGWETWNNFGDSVADTTSEIDVEWIKLEYGKAATPYIPRLYAEELQLCKRYFQVYTVAGTVGSVQSTTTEAYIYDKMSVPMRITPTIAMYTMGWILNNTIGSRIDVTSVSVQRMSESHLIFKVFFGTACTRYSPVIWYDSAFTLDAEL